MTRRWMYRFNKNQLKRNDSEEKTIENEQQPDSKEHKNNLKNEISVDLSKICTLDADDNQRRNQSKGSGVRNLAFDNSN